MPDFMTKTECAKNHLRTIAWIAIVVLIPLVASAFWGGRSQSARDTSQDERLKAQEKRIDKMEDRIDAGFDSILAELRKGRRP